MANNNKGNEECNQYFKERAGTNARFHGVSYGDGQIETQGNYQEK